MSAIAASPRQVYSAVQFEHVLRNGDSLLRMERVPLGKLAVPSGRIVVCDPLILSRPEPLEEAIPVGHYDIVVGVAHDMDFRDQRIAAAILFLGQGRPEQWRLAEIEGEAGGAGYGVDTGIGSIMDLYGALSLAEKLRESDQYGDYLEAAVYENLVPTRSWVLMNPESALDPTCALFTSGIGDGVYASYWGYTADGELACLMTDFRLLRTDAEQQAAA